MIANKNISQNPRIVFFGGSDFSLPLLESTAAFTPTLLVVTHAPTRVGRAQILTPSPVASRAKRLNLEVVEVENLHEKLLNARLREFQPTVGVCASFGMIFSADFLALFPEGIINVHPSLLPRHRGPSPVQWTIREGDRETGITLFVIDELVDHGPIIAQERMPLPPAVSTPLLMKLLATLGSTVLTRTLPHYLTGTITQEPQDETAATLTPMFTRDTGRIDWKNDDAAQIERNIRAFDPWPGAWCVIKKNISPESNRRATDGVPSQKRLKILPAAVAKKHSHILQNMRMLPGTFFLLDGQLAIQTINGVLFPALLQLEGGKPLLAVEFLHGHPWIVHETIHS